MTAFDIIFWLLILLIMVLAYVIESGLSTRHRTLVLSSILSATGAAILMMFLVEDNSKFGVAGGSDQQAGEKEKTQVVAMPMGQGDGLPEVEVIEGGEQRDYVEAESRYEDGPLLKKPGGFRDCPACPLMTTIPAGEFLMGSSADEPGRRTSEVPQTVVRFKRPFAISRYEIGYGEFAAFVRLESYYVQAKCTAPDGSSLSWLKPGVEQATAQHPVVCISRRDVEAYAKWLSTQSDRVYRLPSEAEWEYAARAGTSTPYWTGTSVDTNQANFNSVAGGTTSGGKYDENAFKLFDTAGNVWEMTADCWHDYLTKVPESGVADLVNGDCLRNALRGGAWNSSITTLRSAYRHPMGRSQAFNTVGFRIVREIK